MNDIVDREFEGGVGLYAEDTVIYLHGNDKTTLENTMKRNLKKLELWCNQNRLTVNPAKSKYMLFTTKRYWEEVNIDLRIEDSVIDRVQVFDYLGICLDSRLNFEQHVNELITACNYQIAPLCKIRKYIDSKTAVLLFKSHILSRMNYGLVFCIGATQTSMNSLQVVQNRALRVCLLA